MPKSINDFFNANSKLIKEPLKLIEQLFIEVLDRYDLGPNADESKGDKLSTFGIVNPQIVLTQSFI